MSDSAAATVVCQSASVLSCMYACFCKEVGIVGEGMSVTVCAL